MEIKPTNDEQPIYFIKHSLDTPLGASLLLERILPELTAKQISKASIPLAKEFNKFKLERE